MQAVIIAGGLGTRLRPITEKIPKAMVPINGKPFLRYLLELLGGQGIKDIVLCLGYRGEQVKDYFGGGERLSLRVRYSEEKEGLLGTGGALKQAQPLLEDCFFVINGDTYLPIDYGDVEKVFLQQPRLALMVVYDNREPTGVKNSVALSPDLMVVGYDKGRPSPALRYVEAGVLVLRRRVLDLLDRVAPVSLERGLYPPLIQRGELAAYVSGQRFYDIGTPEQQKTFEEFIKKGLK